ncbi:response regulator transcription factor [Clostridium oceanicum]|uniref:Stage 0 sporulation protein A homolog n=1 Tax=Clostridium oceanicum TaxID=1543 RepID=A0ABN1JIC8_9CLOT
MKKTILIVDDEERMRKLIKAYLKKEGFDSLEAKNGYEAINIVLKEEKIDLIILDIMMPVMDGWSALNKIRKFSNVPVIMLTAKSEEEDTLISFELGTDIYIPKPFSPKVLVANVKALLKRIDLKDNKEDLVKNNVFDGLLVDENTHKVKVDEKEIYLSPKEFQLMVYFIKNKGIVLKRERILETIWGIDYYGDLRTVDTHIKRLREKLGEKSYLIATVRGYGYKFEVKNEI